MENICEWKFHDVIDDSESISLWESVLKSTPNIPVSNYPSFFLPLMKWQYPKEKLYLAICYFNNKPVCTIPLIFSKQSKYGFHWDELSTPLHNHVNLFALPLVNHLSHKQLFVQLAKDSKCDLLKWDRLVLRNVLSDESFDSSIYAGDMAWFDTSKPGGITAIISKKLCKNFARLQRKLERDVGLFAMTVSEPKTIVSDLNIFFKLEKESWIKTGKLAVQDDRALFSFYEDVMQNFSLNEQSKIFFYRSEGEIISGALGFHMGNRLYIHKIWNLPQYSQYAVGSLLIHSIINESINNPKIDMVSLVTSPPWAERWHPEKARLANFVAFDDGLKGAFFRFIDPRVKKIRKGIKRIYKNILKKT